MIWNRDLKEYKALDTGVSAVGFILSNRCIS